MKSLIDDLWSVGLRSKACNFWLVVCRLWPVVCGLWLLVCGLRSMGYSLWSVVCGLWYVVCGPRSVAHGLWYAWSTICGLRLMVNETTDMTPEGIDIVARATSAVNY